MEQRNLKDIADLAAEKLREGDPSLYLLLAMFNEIQALRWQIAPPKRKKPPTFGDTARRLMQGA